VSPLAFVPIGFQAIPSRPGEASRRGHSSLSSVRVRTLTLMTATLILPIMPAQRVTETPNGRASDEAQMVCPRWLKPQAIFWHLGFGVREAGADCCFANAVFSLVCDWGNVIQRQRRFITQPVVTVNTAHTHSPNHGLRTPIGVPQYRSIIKQRFHPPFFPVRFSPETLAGNSQ
jgi:hypothetical protein